MAKENREMVWLQCTETGDLNYRTEMKVVGVRAQDRAEEIQPPAAKHTVHKIKRK